MKLEDGYGAFALDRVQLIEKELRITFPSTFINALRNNDGGIPSKNIFHYSDVRNDRIYANCIGAFLCINPNQYGDLLSTYKDPPEFFPEGLVAFAEDGGGNLICFDYREGRDNPNPPIVYWNHEADIGKDVSFVAKDFETFIEMLKADDEI
jgi:SMI1-KNR4 cell-wall